MKKAFTLTEVLITLGIISIVAVMTIPMLISNIQDQLFKVMYKKDVAMISEAMKLLYANDGITIQATFESVPQYVCRLKNYLKVKDVVFDCARIENYADDPNNNFDNWIVKSYELLWHDGGKWSTKDGLSIMRVITYDYSTMHLSNGAMIMFPCTTRLYIDVNGYDKPNVVGRDIFALPIESGATAPTTKIGNTFNPQSCFGDRSTVTTLTPTNYKEDCEHGHGWGCSFLYLNDK